MSSAPASRVAITAFALLSLAVAGCGRLPSAPLAAHRGDGAFRDESGRIGPVFVQGYTISMPEFGLGRPHEAEYRLAELPEIEKGCGIYLAIVHEQGTPLLEDKQELDGKLEFELLDSDGGLVSSVAGRLGDYIWAHGGNYELYQMDKSFFLPDREKDYTLRVRYSPDANLAGMRGFVWLRCGGSL